MTLIHLFACLHTKKYKLKSNLYIDKTVCRCCEGYIGEVAILKSMRPLFSSFPEISKFLTCLLGIKHQQGVYVCFYAIYEITIGDLHTCVHVKALIVCSLKRHTITHPTLWLPIRCFCSPLLCWWREETDFHCSACEGLCVSSCILPVLSKCVWIICWYVT